VRRRDMLTLVGGAAATALRPVRAFAQADAANWPTGNVTLVSPFTPGGMSDVLGRALGEKLAPVFGRNFIVENRAGAGGTLGATSVARATPDGHTLLIAHIGILAVNPSLYANLQYQPLSSFTYVAPLALVPNVLAVNPKLPIANIAELIAYAKANPGQLNFSSAGVGGAAHIAMAAFNVATGTKMVHVPYRGTPPSITDVISGQVQATFTSGVSLLPHVRSGALRALRGVVLVWRGCARRYPGCDRAAALSGNTQSDGLTGNRAAAEHRRCRSLGCFAGRIRRP
jgi:tripartite-type tricarboxylate transporter receptor subunit TctC